MIISKRRVHSFSSLAVSVLCAMTLFSCKIGLGGSVDVNPPELAISSPAAKSVVNGTITITGTVSDDMGMSKVSIDLKGISTGQGYSYPATLNAQEGTWSLTVPTTAVVDDDYNIVVTATDLAKKNTTVERVIEIDNTAPVIVMERPNSTIRTTDDIDSYGTSLVISGNVVDDHDIEEMWFTVYDENGFPIPDGSIRFTNSPQKFEHATGSEFYEKIYGTDPAGVKKYRYEITAKDSAGNVSTCFYLLDELNSLNSSNTDITATAKNIHSAYKNHETDGVLIQALRNNNIEHKVADKEGFFTLNKSLTPYFTVSGMETINAREGLPNITLKEKCGSIYNKDNQITITLSSNLDGDAVAVYDNNNDPLITVYAVQFDLVEKDRDGKLTYKKLPANAQEQSAEEISKDTEWYKLNITTTPNKKTLNVRLDDSVNKRGGGIQTGKYYAVRVEGKDTAGNKYEENDTPYVFKLEGKGAQPELTVTQPTGNVYVGIGASLEIKGYAVSHDDDDDTWVEAALYSGSTSLEFEGATQEAGIWKKQFQKDGTNILLDSVTLSSEKLNALFGNNSGSKILTLKVTDKSEKAASKEINVTYDIGKPVITFSSVSPTVTIGETEYVNGKITVKGSINDNEDLIKEAKYQINEDTEIEIPSTNSFSIPITTTKYTDNKPLKVTVIAQDRSGNTSRETEVLNVNQSSDLPQITLSNGYVTHEAFDADNKTKNVFGTNQNNQFQGTVTDDDGIASVVLYTCKATETLEQSDINKISVSDIVQNSTNAQFSVKHGKTEEGEYKGRFVVTDIDGKTITKDFWFAVDNGSPQIAFVGTSIGQLLPAGGTVDVELSLADGSGAVTITAEATSTDTAANKALETASYLLEKGTKGEEITNLPAGYTDTVSIPTSSSNYEITYTATDRYGNSSSVVFTFMVDSVKPTISVNWGTGDEKPGDMPLACLDKTGQFTFSGTATDKVGDAAGIISAVKYTVVSADNRVNKKYTVNGTGSFSAIIDFKNDADLASCADQNVTITVTAYDTAGNASEPQSKTIGVDSAAPSSAVSSSTKRFNSNFTLSGTVETDLDVVTTPMTLKLTKGMFTKTLAASAVTINKSSKTWSADFAVPGDFASSSDTDGEYTLTITTVDKYGRTGVTTDNLTIDTTAPTVAITSPKAGEWQNDTAVAISGTVNDGTGVGVINLWYKQSATAVSVPTGQETWTSAGWTAITPNASGNWNFTYTLAGAQGAEAATIYVASVDTLGNASTPVSVALNLDTAAPAVQDAKYQKKNQASAEAFNGTLYVNDDFTVSGTVTDSYKLSSVTVTAKKDDGTSVVRSSETQTVTTSQTTSGSDASWNWNTKFEEGSLSEGTWEIRVDAKDAAGKSATPKTYTVVTDFTAPFIKYDDTLSWPTKEDTKASSYTFQGEITETGSGIQNGNVTLSITDGIAGHEVTPAVTGTTNWSSKIKYADYVTKAFSTEGTKTVTITATDRAGNPGTLTKNFVYDTAEPTITGVNQQNGNGLPTAGTTLTASVADTLQLTSVTVDQYFDGAATPTTLTYTDDDSNAATVFKSLSINQAIPFDGTGAGITPSTGSYKYIITATDGVGNETTWEATLTADLDKPTVAISTPATDTTNTGINAINVNNFSFDGTTSDVGLGVIAVYWQITGSTAESPDPDNWSDSINGTVASWKVFQEFKEKGSQGTGLEEGSYKFWAYSEDKAGNVSTPACRVFDVDFSNPVITTWWAEDVANPPTELVNDKSLNAKTWRTLAYKAYDTYGLADYTKQILTITVDDHSGTPKTLEYEDTKSDDPNKFSVERSADNITHKIIINNKVDGIYTYAMTAEDGMGKKTDFTYTFTYDTTAPAVEITSPDITEWQTKKDIQVIGNASDATGVSAVYWSTTASSASSADDFTKDNSGWHQISGTSNLKFDFKLEDLPGSPSFFNGPVYFGTVDTLGNIGVTSKTLMIDPDKPEIKTTSFVGKPSTTDLFVSGYTYVRKPTTAELEADAELSDEIFIIKGSVTDNYKIDDVVLGAEKGDAKILIHLKDGSNGSGVTSDLWDPDNNKAYGLRVTKNSDNNEWTWTFKLPFSFFTNQDGTWKFTYLLTDVSGQKEEQTTNLIIDTTAPKTGADTVTRNTTAAYTDGNGTKWYKSTAVKYAIKADDDTANGGSGVSTVEYSISGNGADAEWLPMTLNDGNYTGTVNFPVTADKQGANTVWFHITDKAGNIAEISDSPLFDTEPPADATCSTTGELLVNGQNNLEFSVTVSDAGDATTGTGIKQVRVYQLGNIKFQATNAAGDYYIAPVTATESDGTYKLTVSKNFLGTASGAVYVETEDNVGNKTVSKLFQLNVDKTAPTVAISAVSDVDTGTTGIQVNGTITISGTANDDQKLEKVEVEYSTDSGSTWTKFDGRSGRPAVTGNAYNWEIENLNTKTLFTDGARLQVRATAYDKALNPSTPDQVTLIIDQNSDRPLVSLNNFNLTGMVTAGDSKNAVYFKERTIFGNVTDDDGVNSLKVTYTRLDDQGNKVTSTDVKDTGTQYIELSGSSFKFKFVQEDGTDSHAPTSVNLSDGDYLLEFEVTDSYTTFASSQSDALAQPRIRGSEEGTVYNQILVKLDTVAPAIGKVSVTTNVNDTGAPESTATWIDSDLDKIRLGGTTRKFAARFTLSDSSGIKPVSGTAEDSGLVVKLAGARTYPVPAESITTAAGTGSDAGKTVYTVNNLPADQGTGTLQMVITAQDNAGAVREDTVNLTVDNTAPEVTITTSNSKYINGGGIEVMNGTTEAGTTLYLSFTISETEPEGNRTSDYKDSGKQNSYTKWEVISNDSETSAYWTIYFDSKEERLHAAILNKFLVRLGITTNAELNTFTKPTPVYLWIKAVDRAGNESVTKKQFTIDPQGDRPSVEILYPEEQVNNTIPTIGGTQRLSGSAEDNKAVASVWVQLVSQSHSLTGYTAPAEPTYYATGKTSATLADIVPTWDDLMYLVASGYDVYKYDTYATDSKVKLSAASTKPADFNGADYAVLADLSGGSSWSLKINSKKEFDPAAGSKNLLGMRVFALDNENNVSFASERLMEFDADNPVISTVYLTQGNDSREFSDGMFVKGRWHITGTVSDTDNISAITVIQTPAGGDAVETPVTVSGTNTTETFDVELSLLPENAGVGAVTVEVVAKDSTGNSPHEGKLIGIINFDNQAPELAPSSDPEYAINGTVRDTNGFYTMSSVVTEAAVDGVSQSGFERIAFYFTRDLNGVRTLFDPLLSKNEASNSFTVTGIDDTTDSGDIRYMSGMYWKAVSVTRTEEALEKLTLSAADKNIRKGGLVRVSGSDYVIIGISEDGKELVLSGSPKMPETRAAQEVYFAVAQIVDNTVMETGTGTKENWTNASTTGINGYFNTIYNDDGDRMVEYVQKSGGKSHWEASICSKNISDGPITVHYIAFDKAGNYAVGAVNGNVGNNMPRIAGLRLGTDNNGNGSVEPGEMLKVFSGLDKNGDIRSDVVLTKDLEVNEGISALKIKGPVQVSPEIVGGNGGVGYTYAVYAESGDKTKEVATFTEFATEQSGDSEDALRTGTDILFSRETIYEQLPNEDITAKNLKYLFKIWDKTPGTTPGENSQYATVTVLMDMAWKDEEPPKAAIKPFYWKNIHDNSIYGSNFTDETGEYILEDWSGLNGHIELEGDLPDAVFKASNEGIWDLDPKVSGWITIEGTASDDNVVSEILLKITDATGGDIGFGTGFFTIADRSSGSLAGPAGHLFDAGSKPAIWSFEAATDDFTTENGNQVTWKFHWNTAKITKAVGKDILIEVKVKDKGTLSKDGTYSDQSESDDITGLTTEAKLTTQYQVDVVPYIQSITTWLSDLNSLNPTEYSRTAQGHYPVMDKAANSKATIGDETITINGFNLDATGTTSINQPVSAITKSGEFAVTVNEIQSLNNVNAHSKEDERGKQVKIEYNLQSNGSNNLLLTDDVILDIWTINDRAVEGIGGTISNPTMAINPNNDQIGFAFASEKYFSMPDADNSFNYWAASSGSLSATTFVYDTAGHTFGTVSGSAITDDGTKGIHTADNFLMYMDRLGSGQKSSMGTMSGIGGYRMEKIGYKYVVDKQDYYATNQSRIRSASFVTEGESLYLVYYDAIGNEIRFKAGVVPEGNLNGWDDGISVWKYSHESVLWGAADKDIKTEYLASEIGDSTITFRITLTRVNDTYESAFASGKYLLTGKTYYQIESSSIEEGTASGTITDGVTRVYTETIKLTSPLKTAVSAVNSKDDSSATNSLWKVYALKPNSFGSFVDQFEDENMVADTKPNVQVITSTTAGKYVSMDVIPTKAVGAGSLVAVWYDQTAKKLMYSYNTKPTSLDGTKPNGTWSTPKAIMSNGGEYCQVKVDAAGGIHVVCFGTGGIKYGYASSYDDTPTFVTVDSGERKALDLSLDVVQNADGDIVPYISYYCASQYLPKMAYPIVTADSDGKTKNGMENSRYTGAWEIAIIPTISDVQRDNVNVALWKTDSGVQKNSTSGTSTYTHTVDAEKSVSYGQVYGNGSINPVVSYVTNDGAKGYIETAQMR